MADPGELGTARARRALLLRVLRRSLSSRPRDTAWLVAWSTVQAMPSLAAGWVVARATADFLAGHAGAPQGLAWLSLLGLSALASALAARQAYLRVAALVEPLRDDLVRIIVTGALRHATQESNPPDTGAVARITHQAEIVRDSFAGLLAVGLTFAFMVVSAFIGLATLVPAVLPFAIVPIAVSVSLFCCLLPSLAARQRRSVIGEEEVAHSAAAAIAGLRDVIACGAEDQVAADRRAGHGAGRGPAVAGQDEHGQNAVPGGRRLAAADSGAGAGAVAAQARRCPGRDHRRGDLCRRCPARCPVHADPRRRRQRHPARDHAAADRRCERVPAGSA